jgi:hypothetical protein
MFWQGQKKIDTFKESRALCLHHTSRSFGLPQACFSQIPETLLRLALFMALPIRRHFAGGVKLGK